MSYIIATSWLTTPSRAIFLGVIFMSIGLFGLIRLAGQSSIDGDMDAAKGQVLVGLILGLAFLAYGISML